MKLGLFTIFQVPNYGSVLQAFASQYILEKLGHSCTLINYKYPNDWHYAQGLAKPSRSLKALLGEYFGLTSYYRRLKKLDDFRCKHLNLSKRYNNFDELAYDSWNDYDAMVSGSDQIWNVRFQKGDPAFLLSFFPQSKPRFSLASSFALKSIDDEFKNLFTNELDKYKAISVREKNGVSLIHNVLNISKPVEVLLDPTLLLSGDEWSKLMSKSNTSDKPYILWYVLSYAFDPFPYAFHVAKHFQQKLGGCEIKALEGYIPATQACGVEMTDVSDSSIECFIDLFKNASLVITSSFHGTAFALNFGIPLVSIVPGNKGDDRQTTLLNNVGVGSSITQIGKDLNSIDPFYDSTAEHVKLNELRSKSIEWVKTNIV